MIVLIYLIIISFVAYLQKKQLLSGLFKATKPTPWLISGVSLFMYYTSVEEGQIITGVLIHQGVWGLWLFWSSLLGAFFIPFIFAPLWSKLNFITDNQFLLFRYSGKSAKILHAFRSIYVGGIVVSFLLSFHCVAFSRIIQVYFHVHPLYATIIVVVILSVFALKNSFQIKLKTDFIHAIIYFIFIAILFYYAYQTAGSWGNALNIFNSIGNGKSNIFPAQNDRVSWSTILMLIGVQWWSAQLFDGGGPEMARFTTVKGKINALLTALFPVILYSIFSIIITCLSILLISSVPQNNKGEISFIYGAFTVLPDCFDEFCLVSCFSVFITTAESILNWGASFLTIDFYKTYVNPNRSDLHYQLTGLIVMLVLSILAGIISINIDNLQAIIKLVFSISAGVAPVYILRWFCFRINAWTQLSAMIASGIYTLLFPLFYVERTMLFNLKFQEARVICVTVLTTITWLVVMSLTKKDDEIIIQRFKEIIPPLKKVLLNGILAFTTGLIILLLVLLTYTKLLT